MKFIRRMLKYVCILRALPYLILAAFVLPKVEHDNWPDMNQLEKIKHHPEFQS